MPSILGVAPAALLAVLFWTALGLPLARRLMPGGLAAAVAPALGWAVYSAVALPLLTLAGVSAASVWLLAAVCLALSVAFRRGGIAGAPDLPRAAWLAAAGLALLPALALMPKYADGGVLLGPPMFDHAKVAIIDQITRRGLPPQNPFFGPAGGNGTLSYYYLWHFSAAVLAKMLGLTGWAADIALDWFTALASVLLMMGLAVHVGGRPAAVLVVLLSLPASLRPICERVFGTDAWRGVLSQHADIGAWVNQASWVPQHLAAGCCVVLSALLIERLTRPGWLATAVLGLVVASGFESSTWVGGVAFAFAAALTAPLLLAGLPRGKRLAFVLRAAASAALAAALVAPFLISEAHSVAARNGGFPVSVRPYEALVGAAWWEDLLAFWPLVLPFNFPALFPTGAFGLARVLRTQPEKRRLLLVLGCFGFACLAVSWLLKSTIENNDLGWRAAIPAIMLLTVFAAAWPAWTARPWRWPVMAAILLALLGLPQAAEKFLEALHGQRPADAAGFARSAAIWDAVRRHTAPGERVGNNPRMLPDLTPWPDNIAWALLSNRASCYAGWATAIAYAGVSRDALVQIDDLFTRVFAGKPQAGDLGLLAGHFDCATVLLTSADGAFANDPFAASKSFELVEQAAGAWRVYRRKRFFSEEKNQKTFVN
jgi:hypothetical protein